MNSLKTQVKNTGKQAAIAIAKQMRDETAETAREIPRQILGIPNPAEKQEKPKEESLDNEVLEKNQNERKRSLMAAYEAEIEDIKRKKIMVENQVAQNEQAEVQSREKAPDPFVEVSSKRKRGLFQGVKTRIKQMMTKTESRSTPSG